MKKRTLALLLAAILVLSMVFTLISCTDDNTPAGNDGAAVDENIPGTEGKPSIDVVTDPADGGATENDDKYVHN